MDLHLGVSRWLVVLIGVAVVAALVDARAGVPPSSTALPHTLMKIDTHVRVAAVLHIVMACLGLLFLLVVGAMVGAFGALGSDWGVPRDVAAWVGGIGLILVVAFALLVIAEFVGAVLLLQGSESGRIITIVFSVLSLLNLPFGTAIGAYSLWALLREQPPVPAAPVRTEPVQSF